MNPIVFWTLSIISLAAGAMAVGHPRPTKCIFGLLILMLSNSLILLALSRTLVGIEWVAISLGGLIMLWVLLIKPKRLRLGPPGRARISITKLFAMAVVLCFLVMIVWSNTHKVESAMSCINNSCPTEQNAAWISLFLLGLTTVAACVLVLFANRHTADGDQD